MSHFDAVYFRVGTLTTAGTGTLQPASEACCGFVVGQMLLGLPAIAIGIAGLVGRSPNATRHH